MTLPRAFYLLLGVQFVSTIADNAYLIVAIARANELMEPLWMIPLLKASFTISYVLLAPFVGTFADAFEKGRVMLAANVIKLAAASLLLFGVDPVVSLGIAGLGAALYAPAKYGLMTEMASAEQLVKANGYFEGVTVTAVLLGTALGGLLISINLRTGMAGIAILLLAATVISVWLVKHGERHPIESFHPVELMKGFVQENSTLWRDPVGGLSLAVTTALWGVAATLQLLVLRWAGDALGLSLAQAAYMQGITALGLIAGAVLASRWVALKNALRLLPLGVVLGAMLLLMHLVHSVLMAALLMMLVGALAGFFVVPMNALLQHRGCELLTPGKSIAVQGFNENASILLMVLFYSGASALDLPLSALISGFAFLVMISMGVFNWMAWRRMS